MKKTVSLKDEICSASYVPLHRVYVNGKKTQSVFAVEIKDDFSYFNDEQKVILIDELKQSRFINDADEVIFE
jgi:hypothetical protein